MMNCCCCCFQYFHYLSQEKQASSSINFLLSDPDPDGKSADLGLGTGIPCDRNVYITEIIKGAQTMKCKL